MSTSSVMYFAGRRGVCILAGLMSLAFTVSAKPSTLRDAQGREYVPGTVIVKLASAESSPLSVKGIAGKGNFAGVSTLYGVWKSERVFPGSAATSRGKASAGTSDAGTVLRLSIQDPGKTLEAVAAFKALPEVEYAEPVYVARLCSVPDDPDFPQQWYLNNTGQYRLPDADIDAEEAWDITTGDPSVTVAVIDSGVDFSHEDLDGQSWVNPVEQVGDANGDGRPGVAGYDDDGDGLIDEDSAGRQPGDPGYTNDLVNDDDENGYADDLQGWNWTGSGSGTDVTDTEGHGTHVAGIIAAEADNSVGISGVAPGCRIMALKVFGPDGSATTDNLARAIDYARRMGAGVINMSFTLAADSQLLHDALAQAYGSAVLVAAAGNDGSNPRVEYPAAYPFVIGVGASDVFPGNGTPYEAAAAFTNRLSADVYAPGVNILSTLPGNDYAAWSGTSMAAPLVSGVAALVESYRKDQAGWGPDLITGQILSTCDQMADGHRRINAFKALTETPKAVLQYVSSEINDPAPGNENGVANPGETIQLVVTLKDGWAGATSVTATLSTTDPMATVTKDTSDFGSIGPQASDANDSDPFLVTIDPTASNNHAIHLLLTATASNVEKATTATITVNVSRGQEVGGTLSGDVRWTSQSLYLVTSPILVPAGSRLTIGPGTTILFDLSAFMHVDGDIVAQGRPDAPILFSMNLPNPENYPEVWWGDQNGGPSIGVFHTDGSTSAVCELKDCIVEYAMHGVQIRGGDSIVSHCTFRNSYGGFYVNTDKTAVVRFCLAHDIQGAGIAAAGAVVENSLAYRTYEGFTLDGVPMGDENPVTRFNTSINNRGYGFNVGDMVLSADRNILAGNGLYDVITSGNQQSVDMRNNYWGTTDTAEIDAHIFDYNDDFNAGRPVVEYDPFLTVPPEEAPPVLWKVETEPAGTVQSAGTTTFTLTYSGDMSTTKALFVSYGPADPYTQHPITGRWISKRVWQGTSVISLFTGDGNQTLHVDGAESLQGFPALAIQPFVFEIRTTGLSGVALQASGEKGQVRLFWHTTDIDDLAGYNIYRASSVDGVYSRLNPTVVVDATYVDLTAPEAVTQYYEVAAVRTDFAESQRSEPASAAAIDATAPSIEHTPPQSPILLPVVGLTMQANVSDAGGVQGVTLYWRTGGQVDWKSAAMNHVNGSLYSYNIPGVDITVDGLDYYITASDLENNLATWPAEGSFQHLAATSDLTGLIRSIILGKAAPVSAADVNSDQVVDVSDLIMVLQNAGK